MSTYSAIRPRIRGFSHDWRLVAFAALVAFQLVFAWWLLVNPAGDSVLLWVDDLSTVTAPLIAGIICLAVARRYSDSRNGLAWALIAVGLFFSAFGEGSWAFQEIVLNKEVPFPSISDVGYLGAYVPIFFGLLLMPHAPGNGLRRAKVILDVMIGIGAIGLVSWNFVISPLVQDTSGSLLSDSIGIAYPLLDLAIIFAVLLLLARATRGDAMTPLLLVAASFAVTALADSVYTYLISQGTYTNLLDIGWVLGYNLLAFAGLLCLGPRPRLVNRQRESEGPPSFWQSALIYATVLPAGAVAFLDSGSVLMAGIFASITLMFIRQMVTLRENLTLNRKLTVLTADLEDRIKVQQMALLRSRGQDTSD